jgi:hypothetical protein
MEQVLIEKRTSCFNGNEVWDISDKKQLNTTKETVDTERALSPLNTCEGALACE